MEFELYKINATGFLNKKYEVFHEDKLIYNCRLKGFLSQITMHPVDLSIEPINIKKKLSIFKLNIEIHQGKNIFAIIEQGAQLFGYDINVQTQNEMLKIEGNMSTTEFTIKRGTEEICKISRKTFKSTYGVAINKDEDQSKILSIIFGLILIVRIKQAAG